MQGRRPAAGIAFSLHEEVLRTPSAVASPWAKSNLQPLGSERSGFQKRWGFRNTATTAARVVNIHRHPPWVSGRGLEFQTFPSSGGFSRCGPETTWTQTGCWACFKADAEANPRAEVRCLVGSPQCSPWCRRTCPCTHTHTPVHTFRAVRYVPGGRCKENLQTRN